MSILTSAGWLPFCAGLFIGATLGVIIAALLRQGSESDLEMINESLEVQRLQALRVIQSHERFVTLPQETKDLIKDMRKILEPDSTNG